MRTGCDRPLRRPRPIGSGAAAAALLLLAACGGQDARETTDARPRNVPPAPAPEVPAAAIPPTLSPDPLWKAPFSAAPEPVGDGFAGPVMPSAEETDLRFVGVDSAGVTRWSTPRNPSCTAFAVTRADGRELLILLDSDADPDDGRGPAATRTTAAAYAPHDGTKAWGPVEVPGTLVGPGLIFAAIDHTVISDDGGPETALSAATGDVAADENTGEDILHEHDGTLLVQREGRLRAVDTTTGRELWNSGDLPAPEHLTGGTGRLSAGYGPRPATDASGVVALEWRASGDGGDPDAYTINDLRTGTPVAELSARAEPRIIGAADGETAIVTGMPGTDEPSEGEPGVLLAVATEEPRVLWSRQRRGDGPAPKRIVADVLYLSADGGTTRAVDMRTGEDLASGSWPVPAAASSTGVVLLPVESPGMAETFAAMPAAP